MALTIDMTGKVVMVSGVAAGIGAGVARIFAAAGAHVSGADTADHGPIPAENGLYTRCDVTRIEDLSNWVNATVRQFGKVDVLVSNAGGNVFAGAAECTEELWQKNLDLNLASHWRLGRLCRPHLAKHGGTIIIMASNHAYASMPGCFPYNVTKTALTGLVRAMALEWAPSIRTVGIAPGFIDTPGGQRWFESFPDPEAQRKRTVNLHPVRRLGTPEEVGAWCLFLASPYSAFASGATYLLDGGRSAVMQDET